MIINLIKKITGVVIRYFSVFLPITTLILLPIYLYGEDLGIFLIDLLGPTLGLYIRPILISLIPITIFSLLRLPSFNKFNEIISFRKISTQQIHFIYKSYIYSLGSFAFITFVVVFMTVFVSRAAAINWYTAKDYIFVYLLLMLVITPMFHIFNIRKT